MGNEVAVSDGVIEGVGNSSVLVGITEGVRLGSFVTVEVGAKVVTLCQPPKSSTIVK